jgi:hypothetical protein
MGPGLPIGGDYGTILAYFVNRGRPTYGFAGMPPSKAVVGVEVFLYALGLAPQVYLFLDQSMAAESWYYVYRYLYGTAWGSIAPPLATAGPVSGSPGPLVLISSNVGGPPNGGVFWCELPKSAGATPSGAASHWSWSKLATIEQMGNPLLVQISLGNAPVRDLLSGIPVIL